MSDATDNRIYREKQEHLSSKELVIDIPADFFHSDESRQYVNRQLHEAVSEAYERGRREVRHPLKESIYREALEKIAHPERGLRPQDKEPFLKGFVPPERRAAIEALKQADGLPHYTCPNCEARDEFTVRHDTVEDRRPGVTGYPVVPVVKCNACEQEVRAELRGDESRIDLPPSSTQPPPVARSPDGHAYRYESKIHPGETYIDFSVRNDSVIESIPYWLGTPPTPPDVRAKIQEAMLHLNKENYRQAYAILQAIERATATKGGE
jgi:hypothetical protein